MDSVTTKVAVEIPMHFEESDGNAAARKEKSKHGAGGSTADDTTRSRLQVTNLVLSERSLIHIVCSLILSELVWRLAASGFTGDFPAECGPTWRAMRTATYMMPLTASRIESDRAGAVIGRISP
jgi:hypothetical protein